jgi:serine protease Do
MNRFGLIAMTAIVAALVSFTTFRIASSGSGPDGGNDAFGITAASAKGRITAEAPDFMNAAALVTQSIVHIKVMVNRSAAGSGRYDPYYDSPRQSQAVMGSGSGVIFSQDGYIITNNHVIEGATAIQVILTDKRIFEGKLVGADPNTDLAVIKISTKDLKAITIGNSDQVQVGEWVLAAGYPFSLNTTVTAGIVSAKGRSIGIIGQSEDGQSRSLGSSTTMGSAVEAFIQTDAAINPGNSGGALVNTSGQLVGINAAIASQSGSYEGYGFAIPVNLADKIVKDLIKYGEVRRGLLGVSFPQPSTEDQFLIQQGIKPGSIKGAYVTDVQSGSAAAQGGLKAGDIIQGIDDATVNSSVELSERIARHSPGDVVKLRYKRGEENSTISVKLKAQEAAPKSSPMTDADVIASQLGASFAPLSSAFKQRYGMPGGLGISKVNPDGLLAQIGLQSGSIILSINGYRVNSLADMANIFRASTNGIMRFECLTSEGQRVVFNLSFGA